MNASSRNKILSVALSAALIATAPGLGCYEALAKGEAHAQRPGSLRTPVTLNLRGTQSLGSVNRLGHHTLGGQPLQLQIAAPAAAVSPVGVQKASPLQTAGAEIVLMTGMVGEQVRNIGSNPMQAGHDIQAVLEGQIPSIPSFGSIEAAEAGFAPNFLTKPSPAAAMGRRALAVERMGHAQVSDAKTIGSRFVSAGANFAAGFFSMIRLTKTGMKIQIWNQQRAWTNQINGYQDAVTNILAQQKYLEKKISNTEAEIAASRQNVLNAALIKDEATKTQARQTALKEGVILTGRLEALQARKAQTAQEVMMVEGRLDAARDEVRTWREEADSQLDELDFAGDRNAAARIESALTDSQTHRNLNKIFGEIRRVVADSRAGMELALSDTVQAQRAESAQTMAQKMAELAKKWETSSGGQVYQTPFYVKAFSGFGMAVAATIAGIIVGGPWGAGLVVGSWVGFGLYLRYGSKASPAAAQPAKTQSDATAPSASPIVVNIDVDETVEKVRDAAGRVIDAAQSGIKTSAEVIKEKAPVVIAEAKKAAGAAAAELIKLKDEAVAGLQEAQAELTALADKASKDLENTKTAMIGALQSHQEAWIVSLAAAKMIVRKVLTEKILLDQKVIAANGAEKDFLAGRQPEMTAGAAKAKEALARYYSLVDAKVAAVDAMIEDLRHSIDEADSKAMFDAAAAHNAELAKALADLTEIAVPLVPYNKGGWKAAQAAGSPAAELGKAAKEGETGASGGVQDIGDRVVQIVRSIMELRVVPINQIKRERMTQTLEAAKQAWDGAVAAADAEVVRLRASAADAKAAAERAQKLADSDKQRLKQMKEQTTTKPEALKDFGEKVVDEIKRAEKLAAVSAEEEKKVADKVKLAKHLKEEVLAKADKIEQTIREIKDSDGNEKVAAAARMITDANSSINRIVSGTTAEAEKDAAKSQGQLDTAVSKQKQAEWAGNDAAKDKAVDDLLNSL